MGLSNNEIKDVQTQWEKCGHNYKSLGIEIFEVLFKNSPSMKNLYTRILAMPNADEALGTHVERVMKKFDVSIGQLSNPNVMAQDLKTLGSRHPGYGVIPAKHKKPMKDAFFAVIKKKADGFNESAWDRAWELITGSMGLF